MSITTRARLASVLAEIAAVTAGGHRSRSAHMVRAALQLGGIFAWGVEQGHFARELLKPETAKACESTPMRTVITPTLADIRILRPLAAADAGLSSYSAIGKSGEALTVFASVADQRSKLAVDARLAEKMLALVPERSIRVPTADLVRLVQDIALIAAMDSDLGEEARGLRTGPGSNWFESPRLVSSANDLLIETELAGTAVEELPDAEQEGAYVAAVMTWARMLLKDRFLIVSLRRDRLRLNGAKLGLSRWAGARQSSPAAPALLQSLVMAAYEPTLPGRQQARDQAAELVAAGLGLEGSLDAIMSPILALVKADSQSPPSRKIMAHVVARQSAKYRQEDRTELVQMLRQLVWLRDLGIACNVADLSRPWRELHPGEDNTSLVTEDISVVR